MPLINGEVKPDGITLDYQGALGGVPWIFYEQIQFQRYDLTLDVRGTGVFNNMIRGCYPDMINTGRWGMATHCSKFEKSPNSNNEANVDDKYIQDLRWQMFDIF
ncbi:MAG: hypothetical protein A2Z28_02450 [Chloroflexi bacterium RBG_16_51_9]|nr:MAG: hypothetical protein A2Z28_02450 [Chloroflexi bacterium RBG_16_51_9]